MALLVLALASVLIPTAASALVCGDGILDLLEECDLGAANGASDSCCTSSCMFRPAGEACRPAAGACDAVESCTGLADVCPPDLKSIGVCRPAADVCDGAKSSGGQAWRTPPQSAAAGCAASARPATARRRAGRVVLRPRPSRRAGAAPARARA